jgi:hypothetical protein
VAQIRRHVAEFLAELRRRLPQSELRLMTGMAQGADLLVVQAALQAGWKIDAVLPLPLARYIEDFDAHSADELRVLLANPAVSSTELPAPAGADATAPRGTSRAAFYSNLTQLLTEKCNLLLALWDGKSSSRAGGTAYTVSRYLATRSRFVYWVPTPRGTEAPQLSQEPAYLSSIAGNVLTTHGREMPEALAQQLNA